MNIAMGSPMARVVSFDLYGTLVDWRTSIDSYITHILGTGYVDSFFQCDLESVSRLEGYKPYSEILGECLRRVFRGAGKPWRDLYREALVIAFAKSPPFPDALVGLMLIKEKGFETAVISNTEKRLIRITLAGMEHLVDRVVTAEDIGVYKPNRKAFIRAYRVLGIDYSQAIHVSAYPQYDLEAARSLGIRAVHLNRYGYRWELSIERLEDLVMLIS